MTSPDGRPRIARTLQEARRLGIPSPLRVRELQVDNIIVNGATQTFGSVTVEDLTVSTGNLDVDSGNTTISGNATIGGAATVSTGDLTVTAGDAIITAGDLTVTAGDATIGGSLSVGGNTWGQWTAFTPTLIASTTSPTLGSGSTASGRYLRLGNIVFMQILIEFGTGSSAGSGTYSVRFASAPSFGSSMIDTPALGTGFLTEAGVAEDTVLVRGDSANGDRVTMRYNPAGVFTSSPVTHSAPFAWGDGDKIRLWFQYEVD